MRNIGIVLEYKVNLFFYREPSDGQIVASIAIPSVPNNNPDTNLSGLNVVSTGKGEKNKSDTDLHCIKTAPSKKSPRRYFSRLILYYYIVSCTCN
jgi:hypothetical protein